MTYIYTGTIKQLRENKFVVHFQKEKRYCHATRKTDSINSVFIYLGNGNPDELNKISMLSNENDGSDIASHIQDLIEKGLAKVVD